MRRCRISGISSRSSFSTTALRTRGQDLGSSGPQRALSCREKYSYFVVSAGSGRAAKSRLRGPIAPPHRWRRCCKTEKCMPGYSCRTAAAACRIVGSGLRSGMPSPVSVIFRLPRRNSGFPSLCSSSISRLDSETGKYTGFPLPECLTREKIAQQTYAHSGITSFFGIPSIITSANHDNPFCMGICDRTLPTVY